MEVSMSSPLRDEPLSTRLVRAFHDDVLTETELQRAYARFLQRRSPRRAGARLQVPLWIALGMLLGLGSVYAATSSPLRSVLYGTPSVNRPHVDASNPRPAGPLPQAQPLPSSQPPVAPPIAVSGSAAGRVSAPASSVARESWQRAARGLRERDLETADDALQKLAQQGDVAEREKAQLVRAQLLLSQARKHEARVLLMELSRSAGSPALRAKASDLLGSLAQSTDAHRSFELDGGTK